MDLAQHPSEFESSDLTQPKLTKTPEALIINIASKKGAMTERKAQEIKDTLERPGKVVAIQIKNNYEIIDLQPTAERYTSPEINIEQEAIDVMNRKYLKAA